MVAQESDKGSGGYGIGVVSRLTGISRDALRVWERRYGVVKARRTDTRRRLYSQEDIKRLMLVKALVDSGHAISSVANLATAELEKRIRADAAAQPGGHKVLHQGTPRVVVIGPSLARLVSGERFEFEGLELAAAAGVLDELEQRLDTLNADVIVTERTGLFDDTLEELLDLLDRAGARRMIVAYSFASKRALATVRKNAPKVTAIQGPVNAAELRLACLEDSAGGSDARSEAAPGETPQRMFTAEELEKIATASTTVKCECPHHLVTLISSLNAFEDYSEACENRNAADAALHAHLFSVTARSRRLMEEALSRVAAAEGILTKSGNQP